MLNGFIQRIGVVKYYRRGSEIISEDGPTDRVFEVISGAVCTSKMLKAGRRQIAGFYFTGDVFGLESAEAQTVAAQAITDARVRLVKKQVLNTLARRNTELADRLLSVTARELGRKQDAFLLVSRSAEERVIFFLAEMAQRVPVGENRICLPMARMDIADYLGLSLETVSRVFWDLERRGAIEISGRHNVLLLNQPNKNVDNGKMVELFEGVRGRRPYTEVELDDWLASPEGKAATLFDVVSHSRCGEKTRS